MAIRPNESKKNDYYFMFSNEKKSFNLILLSQKKNLNKKNVVKKTYKIQK